MKRYLYLFIFAILASSVAQSSLASEIKEVRLKVSVAFPLEGNKHAEVTKAIEDILLESGYRVTADSASELLVRIKRKKLFFWNKVRLLVSDISI